MRGRGAADAAEPAAAASSTASACRRADARESGPAGSSTTNELVPRSLWFFQLVAVLARPIDASSPPPFTLRGVTGRLRRILAEPGVPARDRVSAASTLAALAADGVSGADPAQWHGLLPVSTTQRLFEGEPAPVRPSSIDKLEKSALDWFLESVARSDPGMAANVGTIMHSALELAETTDANDLWKTVEARWSELAFESQWLEERQKRQMWKFTQALAEYL